MTLRHALLGVALCAMALTLFACVEPAPMPPSPPPVVEGPPPSPEFPVYFVNVSSLALREGPTTSASQISTLNFNDQVELMNTSGGWGQVRVMGTGLMGWSYMRYLQPVPAGRPRSVPSRRPSAPKQETPKPATPKAM
jgi:hypothetical protein